MPASSIMQYLQQGLEQSPVWKWFEIKVEQAEEGFCRLAMPITKDMINLDDNTLHGGVIATLIDEAVGAAMSTYLMTDKDVKGNTTIELNVSYLEGVLTPQVFAEGRIVRKGRTLVVGQADILDGNGKLCARGRATYMTFR